jgi:hypothetical protein
MVAERDESSRRSHPAATGGAHSPSDGQVGGACRSKARTHASTGEYGRKKSTVLSWLVE